MRAPHIASRIGVLLGIASVTLHGQSTGFTYQGQLRQNGTLVSGLHDIRFILCDAESGGNSLGEITATATQVTEGLFTVHLDFGRNVFDGSKRWIELAVRPNGGTGITELAPRIEITPAPCATFAADSADSYPVGTVIDWWRMTKGRAFYQILHDNPLPARKFFHMRKACSLVE